MRVHLQMILWFLMIFISVAADPNYISINCGGAAAAAALGGGQWLRDAVAKGGDLITAVDPATARVSLSQSSYSFQVSPINVKPCIFSSDCHGKDIGFGQKSMMIYADNSRALERVHYRHIKWGPVSSDDDIGGMFGMWAESASSLKKNSKMAINNKTWRVSVDVGFRYLVRLHLCEVGPEMEFVLLINNVITLTSADMIQQRGDRNILWYNDYMVMVEARREEEKRDISISLHSHHEFLDRHGPVEGFEVFKLSNDDRTLASPGPLLPRGVRQLHKALLYNLFLSLLAQTIILTICMIVFMVHLEHKMSEYYLTTEVHKPSAREKHSCRLFSLAEIQSATENFHDGRVLWVLRDSLIEYCNGAGRVLDYLYFSCVMYLCYLRYLRYLKALTILLDEHLKHKVSDFGLAKIGSGSVSLSQHIKNIEGTFGYMDSIFFKTPKLTEKRDIYSFGVGALCGRPAPPWNEQDKGSLTTWDIKYNSMELVEHIVVPSLRRKISLGSMRTAFEAFLLCEPFPPITFIEALPPIKSLKLFSHCESFPCLKLSKLLSHSQPFPHCEPLPRMKFLEAFPHCEAFLHDKINKGFIYKISYDEPGSRNCFAVKKLNSESMESNQEWQSEVNSLGRLSHPNLEHCLVLQLKEIDATKPVEIVMNVIARHLI